MAKSNNDVSGWVGWIFFGSFMMMLLGVLHAIAGLVAVMKDSWYVVGTDRLLVFQSVETWGWIHLFFGMIVFFTGMALMNGSATARILTVLFVGVSVITNMLSIELYPVWSLIMITIGMLIIYATIVHGGELKETR